MCAEDLPLLCWPRSRAPLEITDVSAHDADGEILEGWVAAGAAGARYPNRNDISRFNDDPSYNASWDYEWIAIDGVEGPESPDPRQVGQAYFIHDLFERSSHGGGPWSMGGKGSLWTRRSRPARRAITRTSGPPSPYGDVMMTGFILGRWLMLHHGGDADSPPRPADA
jgi:hypothetical protein